VLTEVALKVLPRTHTVGTLICEGLEDTQAVAALSRALGSPYEVTGAAHRQESGDGPAQTFIRIEGTEASVTYRAGELIRLLQRFGTFTTEMDQDRCTAIWTGIRDVATFHGREGDVWRLSVKPTDAPEIVARIDGAEALYDWGGGLIWLLVPKGTGAEAVRGPVTASGGHATLMRGDRASGPFHPLPAPVAALQDGLRQKFDPRGILNPGLMGQGTEVG
jgi:glycolate oxidase FAD binding subunit